MYTPTDGAACRVLKIMFLINSLISGKKQSQLWAKSDADRQSCRVQSRERVLHGTHTRCDPPVAVQPQISSRGRRPSGSYSTTQRKSASIPSRLLPLVSGTHAATKTRSRRRRRRRIRVRCRGHTRLIHPEFTASLLRPGAESQQRWRPPLLPTIFLHTTRHTATLCV